MKHPASHKKIPDSFKPLLWSYDFSKVDVDRDKKAIVIAALNYGDLNQWRWVAAYYGKKAIRRIIEEVPATEFRDRIRPLIALMFGVQHFNYAPRGTR